MGLLDKVKTQAEQTAAKAREGVEEMQSKRELSQAYAQLGKTAFELLERGEIAHAELDSMAARIRELSAGEGSASSGASDPAAATTES